MPRAKKPIRREGGSFGLIKLSEDDQENLANLCQIKFNSDGQKCKAMISDVENYISLHQSDVYHLDHKPTEESMNRAITAIQKMAHNLLNEIQGLEDNTLTLLYSHTHGGSKCLNPVASFKADTKALEKIIIQSKRANMTLRELEIQRTEIKGLKKQGRREGEALRVMTTGVAGGLLKPRRGSVTCTP